MKSIRAKLVALLLCCVLFSSAIVGIICIIQTSTILEDNARDNMVLLCEKNARSINTVLNNVKSSVDTLAHYVTENLASTDVLKDKNSAAYLQYLLKISQVGINHASSFNGTLAVYAVFDPAVYGEGMGFLFTSNEDGQLQSAPVQEFTNGDNYLSAAWWTEPVAAGKSVWINSYIEKGDESFLRFSYVVPIYYNNEFLGVIGMQFPEQILNDIASTIELKHTGYAVILDSSGRIVFHPEIATGTTLTLTSQESQNIKSQFDQQISSMFNETEYDINQALCQELFPYEHNDTEFFITFCTLRNGMVLCLNAPADEIYNLQLVMINRFVVIISIVTLVVLGIALIFANHIASPIVSLNKSTRAFTEGDFDTAVIPCTKDEIGELAENIEKTRIRMKSYIDELYTEAHIDGLTGTHNGSAYKDEELLINAQIACGKASFSAVVFDVNYLKMTNDTFGHIAGDELLKKVAVCLKNEFGPQNVFRTGGDEFVAVIYGEEEDERTLRAMHGLAEIGNLHLDNYPDMPISCAMGVATFDPSCDKSLSDTLARADSMMYKNKADTKKDTPFWDMNLTTIRDIQINRYLEFLSILSNTMEAYLFLYDIVQDKFWLFDNVHHKLPIAKGTAATSTLEEMLGLIHPLDREMVKADIKKVISGESLEHFMNYRWITDDGMTIWINGHGRIIKDAGGTPFFILGRISDQLLRKWYNPLTGLFNKNKFVADYREHTIAPFTRFMLINIDNLSHINLKYGRKYGDEMLCILANALSEKFSNHILYHMEKDHFAVLLNTEDENEIRAHVEDIRTAIGDKVSFSVAIVPIEKKYYIDADSIFEYAQHLIKNNKSQGEGAITFFTEEDFAKALSTIELVVELEKSIYQNNFEGFFLVYQPQIDAKTHKVVSAEALLRYKSPQKGLVFPNDFIPPLERTQMICEVGIWVLDCALAQCKQWRKRLPDLRISVNLSPVQLNDETIADKILNTIKKHDLPTNVLTLELTECMELEETALYSECFAKLRQAGVHIAIDDFGTGYSNLSYLKKVQADQLKIDQIFVKDVRQGTLNFTLISNIAKFAKTNGFSVCMEGVETVEELSVLELLSPDMLQGYIFNKPIVAEQFEAEYVLPNQPAEWSFKKDLIKQRERLRFAYFDATNILSQIKIGLWMLNINEQTGRGRLFADDTIKELFGMENIESHHDCFDFIVSRIPNKEKPNIMQMLKTMQEQADHRVVQLEYYWNHPTRGKILVRCTGKFSGAKDGVLMFEGFLRIIDDQYSMVK